jgi:DNA helicase-2/ATP-dependent DNA helicase PcrA
MNNDVGQILEGLNPPQREAVETIEGPLLILAGAGSGKTRVVTRRVANLIAHNVRPWEILAITFTNKAAEEMRRRVEGLVGQSGVWLSTFHSFCARVLRREAEALGYTRDFTIYDEDDSTDLIKDIIKRMSLGDDSRYSARNVRHRISQLKNQALRPGDLDETLFHERLMRQIFEEYEAGLKKNQALDFDDLLRNAVILFQEHPDVMERYRGRFRYVLVDEYQDTNKCQYLMVKMLGEKHRNVCATGDPDQSIYAWRGADVRNILSFERDFPEAKVVKLEQNYRSTKQILAAASALIEHNKERKKKKLWTENAAGETIHLAVSGDEQLEAYEVARQVEAEVRNGRRYSDIAVFYRTNAQSRAFEEAFKNNIPHIIVGGITFYERREVKDALAYLRLIINPKDDVSFRRAINVPRRGLGDSTIKEIEGRAIKLGCSLLEAIVPPAAGNDMALSGDSGVPDAHEFLGSFKPKARQGLTQFVKLMTKLRGLPPFPVVPIVKAALEESGLRESFATSAEMERVENLEGLVNAAAEFDDENDPAKLAEQGPPPEPGAYDGLEELAQQQASLAGFLEKVALLTPTDNYDPSKEYVTLMTLHMAKGLEFPVVFLTGMEDGLAPLLRTGQTERSSGENEKELEEERRLVYVGMTRAKEKLYLSRAMRRRRYGSYDSCEPSRFLDEVPAKLLQVQDHGQPGWSIGQSDSEQTRDESDETFDAFEREVGERKRSSFGAPRARHHDTALRTVVDRMLDRSETQEDAGALEVGDRVRHAQFGTGTVESLSGSGLSRKARVHFHKVGPKLLLLSIAKLEKM